MSDTTLGFERVQTPVQMEFQHMTLRLAVASDLLIYGKLVPGSGGTFDIVNPATEEVIGQAADATPADMDECDRRRPQRL